LSAQDAAVTGPDAYDEVLPSVSSHMLAILGAVSGGDVAVKHANVRKVRKDMGVDISGKQH
jgi:hypothetical protein